MLFAVKREGNQNLRLAEGDASLVLWDFHDLVFHARSTSGRHANPLGAVFAYGHLVEPIPAVRPCWPGRSIRLHKLSSQPSRHSRAATLLRARHSARDFDDAHPITLAELSRFLDRTARVHGRERLKPDDDGPVIEIASRPYPSGGASYELELYLAVNNCVGLPRGFYHYDAARHALVPIEVMPPQLDATLADGSLSMGASRMPQILVTITARFGRVSWKYSAIAYSLVLKDVGVLMQTFYIMATDMRLGVCAIGASDIEMFAKMTGIEFHVESPVGQVALGRELKAPRTRPNRQRQGHR
jgi:SagB-type dehydrogenase family enzyme